MLAARTPGAAAASRCTTRERAARAAFTCGEAWLDVGRAVEGRVMEEPDLKIVRAFVNPGEYDPARSAQLAVDAASRYPSESDVWLQGGRMLVPRLVPEVVPSRSVALHIAPDETILITGTQRTHAAHAAQRMQRTHAAHTLVRARVHARSTRTHALTQVGAAITNMP